MRILAISDVEDEAVTASLPARAGSIDLVLGCGDLTYDYLDYVATAVAAPLRAVHGNHDVPPETLDDHEVQVWWEGIDLHGRVASIDGVLVGGLEGSPRYNNGPFQSSETDMWIAILRMLPALVMNRIRRGRFLDVLITHHLHGHTHVYDARTVTQTRVGATTVINVYGARAIDL